MPDFLLIGAQKCGTTSLYRYLVQHPKIYPAAEKEVHFFDLNFDKGPGWYGGFFRKGRVLRKLGGGLTGEATPFYIFHPLVPARVRSLYPDMKLIAIIRDPVERAYSHYVNSVKRGHETLGFEDALSAEDGRLSAEPDGHGPGHQHFGFKIKGVYADQLMRWHSVFPRDRLLVLTLEELREDPEGVTAKAVRSLGLKPHPIEKYRRYNAGKYEEGMRPETRDALREYFRPHNRRLSEYLGRELPWGY